ncbi:ribosomal-processing cysteine protease Prp [Bacillus cereus]|uniref:ribosomal-processing cysteine protease Prp n=1 Tax=Bacillus cereus TaxID=1396 RepID=UPI000BED78FE|nr:ribosomal-processing cysteine protease Prp [Bacillus cereus]PDZ24589.1 hypothetical protein CON41_02290 [Bacillus cereus]PFA67609.1 hypothetical protein CN403_22730 [Bacillus cereus]
MIYKFGEKHIVFSEHVEEKLKSYRQIKENQHEAGGILMGKVYKNTVIIDALSEPSKEDKSGRNFFERNVKRAQKIVEDAWKESNGERIYLGEWHTHPELTPTPSSDDKRLIFNMLNHTQMEIDFLLMVIMGTQSNFVAVQQKGLKSIIPLTELQKTDGLKLTLYKNHLGNIYGFKVIGFIEFAKKGFDIYNAALSTIFLGTVDSIVNLTDTSDFIIEMVPGYLEFIIPKQKETCNADVSLLFNSMLIQIEALMSTMEAEKKQFITLKIDD